MEMSNAKVYTKNAIVFATFLGGPAIGGFLLARNFVTFGDRRAARRSSILGILGTVLVLGLAFALPRYILLSGTMAVLPACYAGIMAIIIDRYQAKEINEALERRLTKNPFYFVVLYGIMGAAVLISCLVAYTHVFHQPTYDRSLQVQNNVILYVNEEVKDSIAIECLETLKQYGFFEENDKADVFLRFDSTENLELNFVSVMYPPMLDSTAYFNFCGLRDFINQKRTFKNPVVLGFYNPELTQSVPLREVEVRAELSYQDLNSLQRHQINERQFIYYNKQVSKSDVLLVEKAVKNLKGYFPSNMNIDIVFMKDGENYQLKFFVNRYMWVNGDESGRLRQTAEYIKGLGVHGNIDLVMINMETFEEKQLN